MQPDKSSTNERTVTRRNALKGLAAVAATAVATGWVSVLAVNGAPPVSADRPNADAIVRQMSDKLGAAQKFSFKAHREIDADLTTGDGLQEKAQIAILVQRPNKFRIKSVSPGDVRYIYADGKDFTLFDDARRLKRQLYSTVPMIASLDELPSQLEQKFGFTPPLVDFIVSDPYKGLSWRAQTITYAGTDTVLMGLLGSRRVPCHRIALTGTLADAVLWIGVEDLLPRRLTAVVKGAKGGGGLTIEFSDWDLNANIKDEDFVFTPPKGAVAIPMKTEAEMEPLTK